MTEDEEDELLEQLKADWEEFQFMFSVIGPELLTFVFGAIILIWLNIDVAFSLTQ